MRVRALEKCFADGARRREGEVFEHQPILEVPEGGTEAVEKPLPKFLEAVNAPATSPPVITGKTPGAAPTAGELDETVAEEEEEAEPPQSVPDFL